MLFANGKKFTSIYAAGSRLATLWQGGLKLWGATPGGGTTPGGGSDVPGGGSDIPSGGDRSDIVVGICELSGGGSHTLTEGTEAKLRGLALNRLQVSKIVGTIYGDISVKKGKLYLFLNGVRSVNASKFEIPSLDAKAVQGEWIFSPPVEVDGGEATLGFERENASETEPIHLGYQNSSEWLQAYFSADASFSYGRGPILPQLHLIGKRVPGSEREIGLITPGQDGSSIQNIPQNIAIILRGAELQSMKVSRIVGHFWCGAPAYNHEDGEDVYLELNGVRSSNAAHGSLLTTDVETWEFPVPVPVSGGEARLRVIPADGDGSKLCYVTSAGAKYDYHTITAEMIKENIKTAAGGMMLIGTI